MIFQLLLHTITLFLWSMSSPAILAVASHSPSLAKPNCQSHCGHIEIPYPFGIGAGCYVDDWFQIICDDSIGQPRPFLNRTKQEVLQISVDGTLKVTNPIAFSSNCNNMPMDRQAANLEGSPFMFSGKNIFTAMGCGVMAIITSNTNDFTVSFGCKSHCGMSSNTCSDADCCHTGIPTSLSAFNTSFQLDDYTKSSSCNYAFLADHEWFQWFANNSTNISAITDRGNVPVLLEWNLYHSTIEVFGASVKLNSDGYGGYETFYCGSYNDTTSTYESSTRLRCDCVWGYDGNPYLLHGCRDINECEDPVKRCRAGSVCKNHIGYYECSRHSKSWIIGIGCGLGVLFLLVGAWGLHKVISIKMIKDKFFKHNGGLLLELQYLPSDEVDVIEN